jgi:hydrogenase-4 component F
MSAIGPLTLVMTLAPAAAIILILLAPRPRAAEAINLAASAVSLLSIVSILILAPDGKNLFWGGYVIVDGLGGWTILCAAIVYFLASMYAIGYMRLLDETDTPSALLCHVRGFRADDADRAVDE